MKNIIGRIAGFIVGLGGFLLLFKLIVLDNISPSDELAPGMVVFAAILNGLVFAYLGNLIQNHLAKKRYS